MENFINYHCYFLLEPCTSSPRSREIIAWGPNRMSFFKNLYRRFVPKKLDHKQAQLPEIREQLAAQITDEQIYIETVRNAIKAAGASTADKLQFAFMSLTLNDNFEKTKELLISILDYLAQNDPETNIEDVSNLLRVINKLQRLEDLFSFTLP